MIRTIATEEITKNIREMCIEANHYLSKDMEQALKNAVDIEQILEKKYCVSFRKILLLPEKI